MYRRWTHPALALIAFAGAALFAGNVFGKTGSEAPASDPDATGIIEVSVTLEADPNAAARTWLFEVIDARGSVVELLSIGTAGPELTASKKSSSLSYGAYAVRQVLNADDQASCGSGAFFAVTSPSGGVAEAPVHSAVVNVAFVVAVCDVA